MLSEGLVLFSSTRVLSFLQERQQLGKTTTSDAVIWYGVWLANKKGFVRGSGGKLFSDAGCSSHVWLMFRELLWPRLTQRRFGSSSKLVVLHWWPQGCVGLLEDVFWPRFCCGHELSRATTTCTVGFQLVPSPLLLVPLAVGAKEVSGAKRINPSSGREEWEGALVFVVIPRQALKREVVKRRVIRRNKDRPR